MPSQPTAPQPTGPDAFAVVDALVDELQEGADAPVQAFTLARDAARRKISARLLPDPSGYVLLLVQAMVQRGARRLVWRIDTDEVELNTEDVRLTRGDLDALYDSVLGSVAEEARPGLADLALGLLCALKLGPCRIVMTSGDTTGATELSLGPDGDEHLRDLVEPVQGTRIHVRYPLRAGRVGGRVAHRLPEVTQLTERCRYATIPVEVNGVDVARGACVGPEAVAVVALSGPQAVGGVQGEVGFMPLQRAAQETRLIRHGVWVDTQRAFVPADRGPPGFLAVLDVEGLRLDLSRSKPVEDAAFQAARGAAITGHAAALAEHDVAQQVAERRRVLVVEPLDALAKRHGSRKRMDALLGRICTIGSVLLGFGAVFLAGAMAVKPVWLAVCVSLAIVVAGANLMPALLMRILYGASTKSRFGRLFPEGSALREAASAELDARRSTSPDHQALYAALRGE